MKITVTGKLKEYSDGLTVKQLIEAEEVENPFTLKEHRAARKV